MSGMKKIAVITGTRADYGHLYPILKGIDAQKDLKLHLIVTGMHLMREFGYTVREVEQDFEVYAKVNTYPRADTGASVAEALGLCVAKLTEAIEELRPDVILVLGDRWEMLAAAIVGTYLSIVVAHIHGGDVSETVDEHVRHAITRLAHLHFPATKESAERIIRMGEQTWRVHHTGSPRVDIIMNHDYPDPMLVAERLGLDMSRPTILVVQHPVSVEVDQAADQIGTTMKALVELGHQAVVIYPNADPGGRRIIRVIQEYAKKYSFIKASKNLPQRDYLGLMKFADVMVGNSSSGIIEAPSFSLPFINLGTRQHGRERGCNVIDVNYDAGEIVEAVNVALNNGDFRVKIKQGGSPYAGSGEKIANILSELKITPNLLQKKITY